MNDVFGLLIFLFFILASILASILNILIGKNIIKHPMYDNDEKKKYILKMGILCLIPLIVIAIFLSILIIVIKS
jgi:glucan phosphoethanolaminetransferase (alkaline phosphatase superfamily)